MLTQTLAVVTCNNNDGMIDCSRNAECCHQPINLVIDIAEFGIVWSILELSTN